MKVEKKIITTETVIIPDGYEELKNPDISSLRDDDMMTWNSHAVWMTVKYCRDIYGDNLDDFYNNPIYIRKKIVIPTTPGSFYIFENKLDGDMVSWYLDDKGWYAINIAGVVSRDWDVERAKNTLINYWIKDVNYEIVFSHDAGNPLKK